MLRIIKDFIYVIKILKGCVFLCALLYELLREMLILHFFFYVFGILEF